ncbi:MAG: ABC transporter permease subunit [Frankiaceae bacterium]|nr:ABC transporter permease subunit [Frankiaceae bacterium]
MTALVLRASWREQRASFAGWAAAWVVLVIMYAASWPAVRGSADKYDELLRDMPKALRTLIGSNGPGSLGTPEGYLTAELLSFTGPLLVVAMGILVGTRALAGDEESGTLELLLAQPISRLRVLLEKLAGGAAGIGAVLTIAGVALLISSPLAGLDLSVATALRPMAVFWLLGLEALSLGLCLGAVLGSVGRSRALAGAVALGAFVLHALGALVPSTHRMASLSPFETVVASDPFRQGLSGTTVLTLLAPCVAMTVAGLVAFRRRDLHLS